MSIAILRKASQVQIDCEEQLPLNGEEKSTDCTLPGRPEEMESNIDEPEAKPASSEEDLRSEGEDEGVKNGTANAGKKPGEKLSPAMEAAVAAFTSGISKTGCDLNENTTSVPSSGDGGNSSSSSPERKPNLRRAHLVSTEELRTGSFEIATKDDVDAGSVYSLFMEQDFRYHFQHPYFRLFTAYFVTFCNFLIYAEDPVAHSRSECTIPVIGNDFSFVIMKYLPNAWSLLKVIMWLSGVIVGIIIGKVIFHSFLFKCSEDQLMR
ncbi:transmembrane protein 117-like isoform X2 [Elysia marginata]|uniref:Transmembrane protein 117-like isoform X2 n=1 Tax=Elysia marginata TaxID=1093978 RepID=A0AAV4H2J1_9GAST|nr:transmembrane protein 117-like isoform X2 [Elysia marginata]